MRSQPTRPDALDAVQVLNDLIGDLVTGVMVLRYFQERYKAEIITDDQMVTVQKMCLSHLALSLCKCLEFRERYHALVSEEHSEPFKSLMKEIQRRKVKDLRNQYVGHIWNKLEKRPLRHSEIMERLYGLSPEETIYSFMDWVNSPGKNDYPKTVVSIVEALRDDIQHKYSISPEEIVDR